MRNTPIETVSNDALNQVHGGGCCGKSWGGNCQQQVVNNVTNNFAPPPAPIPPPRPHRSDVQVQVATGAQAAQMAQG